MTSLLQRANPVGRGLDWELPAAVVTGALAVLLCGGFPDDSLAEGPPARIVGVQALAVLLISAILPAQSRCSRFQLGLPVSARRLWLSQTRGLLWRGGIILAVAVAVSAVAQAGLVGGLAPPGLLTLLARVASAYLLGIAILQAPWPGVHRVPFRPSTFALVSAVLLGLIAWTATASGRGTFDWVPMLGLAGVVTALNYRAVPSAYSLQPRRVRPAADARPGRCARRPANVQLGRWLLGPALWLYLPIVALMGFLIVGTSGITPVAGRMWLFYVLAAAMHLVTFVVGASDRIGALDHLPVSRRRLLALVFVPGAVSAALGYAVGEGFYQWREARRPALRACGDESASCFVVPRHLHEVAPVSASPVAVAPWGERHELRPVPVAPGTPYGVYSPWATPEGSSREFVAWQLSRAAEAVYGRKLDRAQLQRVYLDPAERMQEALARLDRDLGPPFGPPRGRALFGFACLAVAAVWALYLALAATRRLSERMWGVRRHRSAPSGIPLTAGWAIAVALPIAAVLGEAEAWALPALVEILSRRAAEAGGLAQGLAAAVCVAACAVGYRLAEREYARVEAPGFASTRSNLAWELDLDV